MNRSKIPTPSRMASCFSLPEGFGVDGPKYHPSIIEWIPVALLVGNFAIFCFGIYLARASMPPMSGHGPPADFCRVFSKGTSQEPPALQKDPSKRAGAPQGDPLPPNRYPQLLNYLYMYILICSLYVPCFHRCIPGFRLASGLGRSTQGDHFKCVLHEDVPSRVHCLPLVQMGTPAWFRQYAVGVRFSGKAIHPLSPAWLSVGSQGIDAKALCAR